MNKPISISMCNTKMGAVPSFSLLPLVTCSAACRKTCGLHGCYAKRMTIRRKIILNAWKRNTDICKKSLPTFKNQMLGWLAMYQPTAFRIHIGGDFFSVEYLSAWAEIAKKNPRVKFFAFTKQFDIVREWVGSHKVPKNLSLILSAWIPDVGNSWVPPKDLCGKFPVAWVDKGIGDNLSIANAMESVSHKSCDYCNGDCQTCGLCFNRKRKDGDILFKYH